MTRLIRLAHLGKYVEGHLAIKKACFQRAHVQQFSGLARQLTDTFTPQCRHCQAGRYRYRLNIEQRAQRGQRQRNRRGRRTRAGNQVGRDAASVQKRSIDFRHDIGSLCGRECAREVYHRAACRDRLFSVAAADGRACGKKCQPDLAEIERIDFTHTHVLAAKRH
ncbi:hypothetical protein CFBP1573P_03851 [Pseudomonas syringae pv. persicae]|nr:hypothetical protein CFBP1573P_03851 [Pseudomonas syringae pv. persicae]